MIHVAADRRVFEFHGKNSFYAMCVDAEGCLLQIGHGERASKSPVCTSGYVYTEWPGNLMEVPAYGDLSQDEVVLKVEFSSVSDPVRDLRLRYVSHDTVTDAQPGFAPKHGQPVLITTPRQTLWIRLRDIEFDFFVTACYRWTPEHDIMERWLELENKTDQPVRIEQCFSGVLPVGHGQFELTALDGFWATESHLRREKLAFGTKILESRTINTSALHNPFFMLNRVSRAGYEHGDVWFGQLAYSGNWRLAFEARHDLFLRVFGGYNPYDFELILPPGGTHSTPAFIHGFSTEGWSGASRQLHAFQRERVLPRPPESAPQRPVLYNSWEATSFGVTEQNQLELARKAAAIGVELFVLDDGWFGNRTNERSSLGDWFVRKSAFPNGLKLLIDEVHGLGMQFGLWVEPEMVNPDSDLYRAHPDWVLHFPGRPRTEQRSQLILDFGRPEVVDYIWSILDRLLSEYPIDYFKWDMNRAASEPGSVAGKAVWMKHVAGVYGLMDRLRAKYPALSIESCSSGGARVDAGVLYRTEEVWASDNTDALCRLAIQEGFNYAYCPRVMSCWVTHEKNDQTKRPATLALRFNVAMRGTLGIGSSLNHLSGAELADYARYIAFYKTIRPLVQDGTCYRLLELEEHNSSVWQFVDERGGEAVLSIVIADHRTAQVMPPAKLKGLMPGCLYKGTDDLGRLLYHATGAELMSCGVPVYAQQDHPFMLAIGYSRTIHFTAT
jgi:alpha-galactosidase